MAKNLNLNTFFSLYNLKDSDRLIINNLLRIIKSFPVSEDRQNLLNLFFRYCKRFKSVPPFSDVKQILLNEGVSTEFELENMELVYDSIKADTPLEDDFQFLKIKRNKEGEITELSFKECALKKYLIDNLHYKFIENQIALYNGRAYKLASNRKIKKSMVELKDIFNVDKFKLNVFVDENLGSLPEITDKDINPYLIACNDMNVLIDKDNLDIEHIKIVKKNYRDIVLNDKTAIIGECKTFTEFKANSYYKQADNDLTLYADNNKEIRANLEEFIGCCLFRNDISRKSFLLTGGASCGKSTFCNWLGALIGEENTSVNSYKDLTDKFRLAEIQDKSLNICDELNKANAKVTPDGESIFKRVISNEPVIIEWKGKDPIKIKPRMRFILNCNDLPHFQDVGLWKRLHVIPFNHRFTESQYKDNLTNNQQAINYLFCVGIEGLLRVLKREKQGQDVFTFSQVISDTIESARKTADPTYEWIKNNRDLLLFDVESIKNTFKKKTDVDPYTCLGLYNTYCQDMNKGGFYQGVSLPNSKTFNEKVCNILNCRIERISLRLELTGRTQPNIFKK